MSNDLDEYVALQMVNSIVDITAPSHIELKVRSDGKVVWVNVDGVCRFRASHVSNLSINDKRTETTDPEAGD